MANRQPLVDSARAANLEPDVYVAGTAQQDQETGDELGICLLHLTEVEHNAVGPRMKESFAP